MLSTRENDLFFGVLLLAFVLALFGTYHRYIVREDFTFFTTEEDIPDRFDLGSYSRPW